MVYSGEIALYILTDTKTWIKKYYNGSMEFTYFECETRIITRR